MATLKGICVGDYGTVIQLTCVDASGAAQDVSAYTTTRTLYARPPDRGKTVTATITNVNSGTDGLIKFNFAANDLDRPGDWECQVFLATASANIRSLPFIIQVDKQLL